MTNDLHWRDYQPGDAGGAYYVCLKTGDHGDDGEPFYREDPDALGRVYVGPYLKFAPELALILEDAEGPCGYALGAMDSHSFYHRYEVEWRPVLCREFSDPPPPPENWSRVEAAHHLYHAPDYFCPEPYELTPSHAHIDLLPRAQGRGYGRRLMEEVMRRLRERGSPGLHLGVSARNARALKFYAALGFRELARDGTGDDAAIYMGRSLKTDA